MLSKVAERVYWSARYVERIENTARLISIYDKLLFDLPRSVTISWYKLIEINSLQESFKKHYKVQDERNVAKFLIADEANYSSIVSSLKALRENVRTTRDVLPEDTWEMVNELSLYVNDNLKSGLSRSKRHEYLGDIIKGCQQIQGLLSGSMPRDSAWAFFKLAKTLERADMTTRNLDAGMAAIMMLEKESDVFANTEQVIWGNVLRSLEADQAYRRNQRAAVHGNLVVEYVLYNNAYPRAINFCIDDMIDSANHLPLNDDVIDCLAKMKREIVEDTHDIALGEPLRNLLNDLQIQLGELHTKIGETWFPKW